MGGIKEKVLAAHRIGIRHVILPRRNEREAEEVPPEARKEMQFHFVDTAEEVLEQALVPPGKATASRGRRHGSDAATQSLRRFTPRGSGSNREVA